MKSKSIHSANFSDLHYAFCAPDANEDGENLACIRRVFRSFGVPEGFLERQKHDRKNAFTFVDFNKLSSGAYIVAPMDPSDKTVNHALAVSLREEHAQEPRSGLP